MKSKTVWVAEKETEKNKNGDTWAKQELKAIKKMVMVFYSTVCANAHLILSYFFFIYIFSYLSFFFFTSLQVPAQIDWLKKR